MRKGKYFHYKLDLLEYLVEKNFLVELKDVYFGSMTIADELKIPYSSWYDVISDLSKSELIIIKTKISYIGPLIDRINRIQLTKKGLGYLTRNRQE